LGVKNTLSRSFSVVSLEVEEANYIFVLKSIIKREPDSLE